MGYDRAFYAGLDSRLPLTFVEAANNEILEAHPNPPVEESSMKTITRIRCVSIDSANFNLVKFVFTF